ncbi:hypothetical protein STENM223S_03827 [Streptomyces tendae]
MGWLWAIMVEIMLGLLAKAVIPGKQHIPLWLATLCGIAGAVIGNAMARGSVSRRPAASTGGGTSSSSSSHGVVLLVEIIYNAMQRERSGSGSDPAGHGEGAGADSPPRAYRLGRP